MNRRKFWIAFGAIILCILLLWWLYVAILVDEDVNEEQACATTGQVFIA